MHRSGSERAESITTTTQTKLACLSTTPSVFTFTESRSTSESKTALLTPTALSTPVSIQSSPVATVASRASIEMVSSSSAVTAAYDATKQKQELMASKDEVAISVSKTTRHHTTKCRNKKKSGKNRKSVTTTAIDSMMTRAVSSNSPAASVGTNLGALFAASSAASTQRSTDKAHVPNDPSRKKCRICSLF
jgi:hypothetical protein